MKSIILRILRHVRSTNAGRCAGLLATVLADNADEQLLVPWISWMRRGDGWDFLLLFDGYSYIVIICYNMLQYVSVVISSTKKWQLHHVKNQQKC